MSGRRSERGFPNVFSLQPPQNFLFSEQYAIFFENQKFFTFHLLSIQWFHGEVSSANLSIRAWALILVKAIIGDFDLLINS